MPEPAPDHNQSDTTMDAAADYTDLQFNEPLAEVVPLRAGSDALTADEVARLNSLRSRMEAAKLYADGLMAQFHLIEGDDGVLVDANGGRGDAEGIRKVSAAEDVFHEARAAYLADPLHRAYETGLGG